MSSDGGNQGSNQTNEMAGWLKPYGEQVMRNAAELYSQPYQQYGGQRVADTSDSTQAYNNLAYQRATLGAPDLNSARGYSTDLSNGAYMGQGPTSNNTWLSNTASGQNLNSNPFVQQNSDYTGMVMGDNARNMANAFATGTNATNMANAAMGGAFGGSAYQEKMTADAAALAQQVGQMGNQYNMQRSALGAQDYQQAVQNAMNAGGQQQGAYNADVASRLQGASLGGQLSQDDYQSAAMLRTLGQDQQGQQQKLLDAQYGDWANQMNWGQNNLNNFANTLSQLAGYNTTQSQQQYGGGSSPWGTAAGMAGLLAAGSKAGGLW